MKSATSASRSRPGTVASKSKQLAHAAPLSEDHWQETGVATGYQAFQNDLPSLCDNPKTRGRWVVYVGRKRAEIGDSKWELLQVCQAKKRSPWSYFIGYAIPEAAEAEDVENPRSPVDAGGES